MDKEVADRESLSLSRENSAYAEGFRDARKHWKKKFKKLKKKLREMGR